MGVLHAKLPASGTDRWIKCHGAIPLTQDIEDKASEPAMLGTCAHLLGEICTQPLELGDPCIDPFEYVGRTICIVDEEAHFLSQIPKKNRKKIAFEVEVDAEMATFITEYTELCAELTSEMGTEHDGHKIPHDIYVERFFSLDNLFVGKYPLEEGEKLLGGTGDFAAAEFMGEGVVVDLKYGAGVVVEVEDNLQLITYALGLLLEHPDLEEVHTYIVQPRAPHSDGSIRKHSYSAEQLREYGEMIKESAQAVDAALIEVAEGLDPLEIPRAAGSWCRWCKFISECPTVRDQALETAKVDFDDEMPEALPVPDKVMEISRALEWLPLIDVWSKAVAKRAQELLETGQEVPGYKLVRKRANRRWAEDTETIWKALRKAKLLKRDCFKEPVLKSFTDIEKTSKEAKAIVATLVEKPEGGLTLTHENDKREAVVMLPAAEDFPDD